MHYLTYENGNDEIYNLRISKVTTCTLSSPIHKNNISEQLVQVYAMGLSISARFSSVIAVYNVPFFH